MHNIKQRALQKHLCRCLLASWNLDQNLGETYEYALKWKINLHRFRSSEVQLHLYVYTTTKRSNSIPIIISLWEVPQTASPFKHLCRCVLLRPINWNLDQNLGRVCNRRRHCSWTDTFFFSLILITIKNNSQFFLFLLLVIKNKKIRF